MVHVAVHHVATALEVVLDALQLGQPDGGLQVGEAVVEPQHGVEVGALRVLPLAAVEADELGQFVALAGDHAALARGEGLVAEERVGGHVGVAPHVLTAHPCAQRLGGILDDGHPVGQGRPQRLHVEGHAVQVNRDDGLRARGDGGEDGLDGHVEGVGVGIDEHQFGIDVRHGVGRCHVGHGGHDDLVTRADAERNQRKVQGDRAVGAGDGVLHTGPLGKCLLKAPHIRALPREPFGLDAVGHVCHLVSRQVGMRDGDSADLLVFRCQRLSRGVRPCAGC